jgi:hypothetical protein
LAAVGKGEPRTAVKAPLPGPIVKAEMALGLGGPKKEGALDTKRNLPAGSMAAPTGRIVTEKGEPGTGVKVPAPPFMVKAEMLLASEFVT